VKLCSDRLRHVNREDEYEKKKKKKKSAADQFFAHGRSLQCSGCMYDSIIIIYNKLSCLFQSDIVGRNPLTCKATDVVVQQAVTTWLQFALIEMEAGRLDRLKSKLVCTAPTSMTPSTVSETVSDMLQQISNSIVTQI
jgi:hypothetical protein